MKTGYEIHRSDGRAFGRYLAADPEAAMRSLLADHGEKAATLERYSPPPPGRRKRRWRPGDPMTAICTVTSSDGDTTLWRVTSG